MALHKSLERLVDADERLTPQDKERRKANLLRAKEAGKEYLDLLAEAMKREAIFPNIISDLRNGKPNTMELLMWREGHKASLDHLISYLEG